MRLIALYGVVDGAINDETIGTLRDPRIACSRHGGMAAVLCMLFMAQMKM
jgi:hypothetical protein